MNILFIEDDVKTAAFVVKGLKQEGFTVLHVRDGEEGRILALHEDYDVAIIDIMLPTISGLKIVEDLRRARKNTPVLILSARNSIEDKVTGLQKGGDDYLAKPFAFSELVARLQALMRRSQANKGETTRLSVGDLFINILSREVKRDGRNIDLQPLEFSLLEYLMRNAGRVVSKTMIIEHVWGYNFDPNTNIVESRMSKLRSKVDESFKRPLIHTIRGVGYVIKQDSSA